MSTQRLHNGDKYVFDGSRRLLLFEDYNSKNPNLEDRYKDKVNVLIYQFSEASPLGGCDLIQSKFMPSLWLC